jgi:glyoxylase-like metal-dependent hydrolase (beta-lactamase superfamily II)
VRLFALTCGWLTGPLGGFLAGEKGRLRVPVPCYLVEHRRGRVLFDSGMHPQAGSGPDGRLGELARVFDVELAPGEVVGARLAALGVDAARIDFLVSSHLHFDHAGGNAQVPNARWVVQRREREAGRAPEAIAANHYDPRDYDLGHDVLCIDGEHDLFGDGTVTCLPTFGHTPGHQSLRVRLGSGEIILAADACYLRRTLEDLHLPGVVHDPGAARETLLRLRWLAAAGARIFYGHDPGFWAGVPQAPLEIL